VDNKTVEFSQKEQIFAVFQRHINNAFCSIWLSILKVLKYK